MITKRNQTEQPYYNIALKAIFHVSRGCILKRKRCFNVKFPTYYIHVKTKILADFEICISVPCKKLEIV